MADIAEKVKVSSGDGADGDADAEGDDSRLCEFFPTFVWAVRDFTLELATDGKPISADEYLENALTLKKGFLRRFFARTLEPCVKLINS